MAEITLVRQHDIHLTEAEKEIARRAMFGYVDGLGERGQKQWRRLWNRMFKLEPGEMMHIQTNLPRSGPYHRRHMKIEQTVFEAQERFQIFDQFLYWVKVGAGWVTWAAGPSGGVVPIPRSISYATADQDEFQQFHEQVMGFLRGPHAARYLWPHLKNGAADEMMDSILMGFQE
ncbi:DUF1367 family protein [Eoetvoesiella caeni]|uniref:Uncharacterized protein DUF1367 n=1 Tax=Eoetvoesiella caeni TaxID=645616 RepID=A0A366HAR8_9BURK|nr:DUF1367 family protein [Eoetvoesiella caeni]MCI2809365.1 DUF1367 family protein [Eoetvoesiella caeni]NYT54506.1 DUF1367 family protein [Eoetvoesiella caeni]RBP39305.1 uncharacterized protein DUF1367 [Eoetvoesiella caeni]